MNFDQVFKSCAPSPFSSPKLITDHKVQSGTFNDGLFTVLDESLSHSVLKSWRWLLGGDAVALVATSLGDLFFWSEKYSAVYFLEVQYGKSTFVDSEIGFFLNEFLTNVDIQESVFRRSFLSSLGSKLGQLEYGQCYIAEPWMRHGGTGEIDSYTKGDLGVYTNLVGQAVEQAMKMEQSGAR